LTTAGASPNWEEMSEQKQFSEPRVEREVVFRVVPDGRECRIELLNGENVTLPARLGRIARFLERIGIRAIVCETELESKQVSDVLEALWVLHRRLRGGRGTFRDRLFGRERLHEALVSPARGRAAIGRSDDAAYGGAGLNTAGSVGRASVAPRHLALPTGRKVGGGRGTDVMPDLRRRPGK